MICTAPDCSVRAIAKGLCPSHYNRLKRHGDLHLSHGSIADTFDQHWLLHPRTGCWVWLKSRDTHGYGHLIVGGRIVLAHRFSYMRDHGPLSRDQQVLHRCDRPSCVNPSHLFVGTPRINSNDMWRKGRGAQKLNCQQLREILSDPRFHADIAADYGVCRTTITYVKNGRNVWRLTELT